MQDQFRGWARQHTPAIPVIKDGRRIKRIMDQGYPQVICKITTAKMGLLSGPNGRVLA
jgi:hypothetical protein